MISLYMLIWHSWHLMSSWWHDDRPLCGFAAVHFFAALLVLKMENDVSHDVHDVKWRHTVAVYGVVQPLQWKFLIFVFTSEYVPFIILLEVLDPQWVTVPTIIEISLLPAVYIYYMYILNNCCIYNPPCTFSEKWLKVIVTTNSHFLIFYHANDKIFCKTSHFGLDLITFSYCCMRCGGSASSKDCDHLATVNKTFPCILLSSSLFLESCRRLIQLRNSCRATWYSPFFHFIFASSMK